MMRVAANEESRPRLAVAPREAHAEPAYTFSRDLLTLSQPLTAGAEAIRALRTHVLAQHVQVGRRALAICGASADVGCSFVAANLAVALAQAGIKTLLIDGDLREPTIDRYFRPAAPLEGLVHCLNAPGSRVGEFIDVEVMPHLSIFHAGSVASNAQELLTGEWAVDVMTQCLRDYDITIIDTPPANICADARRISNIVGYSLVVARRNKSLVADVKTLVEQLIDDHAKVIGTIMTD